MQRVRVSSQQSPVHKLGDSQMTLSPNFRLPVPPPPPPSSDNPFSSSLNSEPLIPGLPDDVSLNCLLRLPVDSHPACRSVCRRWHLVLASKQRFFSWRKGLGFRDPWLFVLASHVCTRRVQWQVLDLTRLSSWHTIPPMPAEDRICPHRSRFVAIPDEAALLVCGGGALVSDDAAFPPPPLDNPVLKYEMRSNRWTVMSRMLTARSSFASAVIDGRVYAAGGNGRDFSELSLAEALLLDDAGGDKRGWHPVASMGAGMACYDAAVLEGRLFVAEGWEWPFLFSPRGQIYDPRSDSWEEMAVGLREGWTGRGVVVEGHLFVISEREGMRVKVYDMGSDSWETVVDGSPAPTTGGKMPLSVSSSDRRIYVVGHGLHVAVGHVHRVTSGTSSIALGQEKRRQRFCIRWQEIDAPGAFRDLTPCTTRVLFA